MRVIGYTRVSTDLQVKYGGGLDMQRDTIAEWAKDQGHEVVGWYVDEGESGKNGLDTRVGLAEALAQLEEGAADALVVYRLDRLARDLALQETTIGRLERAGCRVVSVTEPSIDSGDPTRVLVRQVLGAVAEYERTVIRGRLMAGAARKKAAGGYAAGRPPYGWVAENFELRPVPEEQAVIREIRRLREEGVSLGAIANQLNGSGARRPDGGLWRPESVRRVLTRAGVTEPPRAKPRSRGRGRVGVRR